jgi:ERF superfamily
MSEPTAELHDAGTPNLAAALAKVQASLPKLERDRTVEVTQKNGQTYSYSYVTLANLSDAVLPLLAQHGLSFAAMPGTGSDGKMCVRYHLLHESGEERTGEFPISGEGGIQIIGGRITYARRYCLAAVVGVAADEDDEARLGDDGPRSAQRAPQKAPRPAAPTAQRAARTASRAGAELPLPGDGPADAMTEPQKRALMAAYSGRSRDDRIAHAQGILGRDLDSFTGPDGLSKAEAGALLDALAPPPEEELT